MDNLQLKNAYRSFVLIAFCSLFLIGCNSTPEENIEPSCTMDSNENCSAETDNGDDRAYNPCKVNKNLPVCKK